MKKSVTLRSLSAVGLLIGATACVTPLGSSEVTDLTTCHDTDLKAIRKNLLLAGYEIKNEGDSDLVTDFKQTAGWGGNRRLQRVTVVKVDEKTFKFNVRVREVNLEKGNGPTAVTSSDGHRKSQTVVIDMSHPVEVENDSDEAYYKERVERYEDTRREVCGR